MINPDQVRKGPLFSPNLYLFTWMGGWKNETLCCFQTTFTIYIPERLRNFTNLIDGESGDDRFLKLLKTKHWPSGITWKNNLLRNLISISLGRNYIGLIKWNYWCYNFQLDVKFDPGQKRRTPVTIKPILWWRTTHKSLYRQFEKLSPPIRRKNSRLLQFQLLQQQIFSRNKASLVFAASN